MTSGKSRLPSVVARVVSLAAALASALLAGQALAAPATLESVLAGIARTAPATQAYVEVRQTRLLRRPAVSSGTLEYLGPGHLVKSTTAPRVERLEVDGNLARVSRGGSAVRTLDLARAPEVRALMAGLAGVIGGDPAAVRRTFEVTLRDDGRRQRLRLVPLAAEVRRKLTAIEVHVEAPPGAAASVTCVVVSEGQGATSSLLVGLAPGAAPARPDAAWLATRCPAP